MSELPIGWGRARFGEIATVQLGKMLDKVKNKGKPTPYLRNINVRWGEFDLTDILEMRMTDDERQAFDIRDGDVLVCEGGEPGRAAVWNGGANSFSYQKALMRVRPVVGIEPKYLVSFLRHAARTGDLESQFTGTTIKHLPQNKLRDLQLPLPPPAEQQRIVAKLDALTARTARARADLDEVLALASHQRQAVLRRALDDCISAAEWTEFGSILEKLTSGSRDWAKFYDQGDAVFLLASNVRPMRFDPTPKRYVDPPCQASDAVRSRVENDDLLLTIVGAGTGDLCRASEINGDYYVCQSVALLRLKDPSYSEFFELWFQSGAHGRSDIDRAMYGAARPHLGFDDIRAFQVPIIFAAAAQVTVHTVRRQFAEIDRLVAEAAAARRLLDRLDQAILAKAFRGELVPQDPADEPASVLLDRIRTERAASPVKSRWGRRAAAAQAGAGR